MTPLQPAVEGNRVEGGVVGYHSRQRVDSQTVPKCRICVNAPGKRAKSGKKACALTIGGPGKADSVSTRYEAKAFCGYYSPRGNRARARGWLSSRKRARPAMNSSF